MDWISRQKLILYFTSIHNQSQNKNPNYFNQKNQIIQEIELNGIEMYCFPLIHSEDGAYNVSNNSNKKNVFLEKKSHQSGYFLETEDQVIISKTILVLFDYYLEKELYKFFKIKTIENKYWYLQKNSELESYLTNPNFIVANKRNNSQMRKRTDQNQDNIKNKLKVWKQDIYISPKIIFTNRDYVYFGVFDCLNKKALLGKISKVVLLSPSQYTQKKHYEKLEEQLYENYNIILYSKKYSKYNWSIPINIYGSTICNINVNGDDDDEKETLKRSFTIKPYFDEDDFSLTRAPEEKNEKMETETEKGLVYTQEIKESIKQSFSHFTLHKSKSQLIITINKLNNDFLVKKFSLDKVAVRNKASIRGNYQSFNRTHECNELCWVCNLPKYLTPLQTDTSQNSNYLRNRGKEKRKKKVSTGNDNRNNKDFKKKNNFNMNNIYIKHRGGDNKRIKYKKKNQKNIFNKKNRDQRMNKNNINDMFYIVPNEIDQNLIDEIKNGEKPRHKFFQKKKQSKSYVQIHFVPTFCVMIFDRIQKNLHNIVKNVKIS